MLGSLRVGLANHRDGYRTFRITYPWRPCVQSASWRRLISPLAVNEVGFIACVRRFGALAEPKSLANGVWK